MNRRRNWVVNIAQEDADPMIFGPYVEHRARELAEAFNGRIDSDQTGWIHATAHPIQNPGIREMLAEYGQ